MSLVALASLLFLAANSPPSWEYLVAAAVAPLAGWLIAIRQFSGRIGSSEAAELWEESSRIRGGSRQRIADLGARVAALEKENDELRKALAPYVLRTNSVD